jgi:hypothetical protein
MKMEGSRVIKQMWSGEKTSLIKRWRNVLGNKNNVIRWSNKFDQEVMKDLFYHPSTSYYLLIKLVLWPDHICFNTRAYSITTSSNLFYHLITFVLLPEHIWSPFDQTCFITWSHLFYHPSTFHCHLIKLKLSPNHICLSTRALSIITCDNGRSSGDKTNVIRWKNKFD